MKLVEILARELEMWPSKKTLSIGQARDGDLILDYCDPVSDGPDDFDHLGKIFERADDWLDAAVTRPQWQAERDRMKAMEEISKFSQEQDQLQHPVSPTYEQQLWDRVAYRAWELGANDCRELDSVIRGCAIVADSFMAERAKRVGK